MSNFISEASPNIISIKDSIKIQLECEIDCENYSESMMLYIEL
jgi:hypothetical protein